MSEPSDAANRISREVPIGGLGQRTLAKEIDNTLIEEQAARIAGLEDVLEEKRDNINSLRARLSEAVKVLERLAEGEMSDTGHTALREAAKAFVSTLGENKN